MSLKDKFVLMLDDDEESCVLVKKIVENAGCHFQAVHNINQCTDLIHKKAPSIIFLDLNLNGETGFQFLKTRMQDTLMRKIPVVVFSAITKKEIQEKTFLLGASDYLEKPIRAAAILQKLRKNLKEHSIQQYLFSEDEKIPIHLTVNAELKKLNELSVVIRSSIKMEENTNMEIRSELLEKIGMLQPQKATTLAPSLYADSGIYDTRAQLVGLNDKILGRIKKIKTLL